MRMKSRFILPVILMLHACSQKGYDKTDGKIIVEHDTCGIIHEPINPRSLKRELDGYVMERDTFNTLGRNVNYSQYKFFDTEFKGYPKLTVIDVFEFNDTAISVGTDGEFSKVILNTPTKFDIMQLHGNISYNLNHQECLKKSLYVIAQSNNLPKARYEYDTVIDDMKEEQWVSHFKKEIIRTVLYLKNLDGYNMGLAFKTKICNKEQAKSVYGYYNHMDTSEPLNNEERDSLSKEALKRLPPFLFRNWEEYAVPFYRYGYAPMP